MNFAAFRQTILAGAALLLAHMSSSADSLTIRYAGEMMHLPAGSDIVALGGAGVVLPRHSVSALWNPASPAFSEKYEVSAEFADLYEGLSQQACIAMTVPFSDGLGVTVIYMPFFSGAIEQYDSLKGTYQERLLNGNMRANGADGLGLFHNNQHFVSVSIGKLFALSMPRSSNGGFPLPLEIGAGCSFKAFWQSMNPDNQRRMGMNVNLDAGITVRIGLDYNFISKEVSRQLLFGAAVRDFLPSPVMWINSRDEYHPNQQYREEVSPSYYLGTAYSDKSGKFGGNWTLAASLERRYRTTYHYGIEAEFWNLVAFRAGLSDKTPAVGAGLSYKRYFLDYSFSFDELAFSYVRLAAGIRY